MFEIERVKKALLREDAHEGALVSAIGKLKKVYTEDRGRIGEALEDPTNVSAYALFNVVSHSKKFEYLVSLLPEELKDDLSELRFIDWGMGPGTYALSYCHLFQPKYTEIGFVESNPLMVDQAKFMFQEFFPKKILKEAKVYKNHCLFFGHVVNEIGSEYAFKEVKQYDPEVVMFIEPGTKDVFPEVLQLRQKLLDKGYHQVFPCPEPGPCPFQGQDDWCHQILRTTYEVEYERLCQIAKLNRRTLPFIGGVFAKKKYEKGQIVRQVRFLGETKHSFEYQVCENNNELVHIEVPKKTMSKKVVKEVSKSSLGGSTPYRELKNLGNKKRVELT